ncbi:MAG: hypothetical protein ACP5G8_04750 [Athalassotoga sp.]
MLFMVNNNSLQPLKSGEIVNVENTVDDKVCGLYENNGSIIIDECEKKSGWFLGAIVGRFSRLRERREDKDDTVSCEKANKT